MKTTVPWIVGISVAIFAVIGLVRAVSDFGADGFVAYLKLLLGPTGVTVVALWILGGRHAGSFPRNLLPSDVALKRVGIAVGIVTAIFLTASGMFGVGWVVGR